jgi:cyclase
MKNIRIIPRLDVKGPNLVKGIHLEGLRVLGKPEQFARYYYETGADELIYMDVVASLYGRNSLHDIVVRTSKEIFIPLTVGGGLRSIDDIKYVLRAGADKVSLNTAAINNPEIIREASKKFGASTIVISIEAIRQPDGRYLAYTDSGREHTGVEVLAWAKRVESLGAGEIFLTSVDSDGVGAGYDLQLVKMVAESVSIPVIAYGGAGKVEDVKDVIVKGKADAVSLSSVLHYDFIKRQYLEKASFEDEGNIEYLKQKRDYSKITTSNLSEIKSYLLRETIKCRHTLDSEPAHA